MTYSICIPHYGNQAFLAEAIRSVITQAKSPAEVIISLDSPVDTEFRQQFEASFPIRWVENQIPGITSNWNNAVANATGDYVVLLHSDDVLAPDYLDAITRLQKRKPESAAWFCGVNVINEHGAPTRTVGDWVKRLITPRRHTYDIQGDRGLSKMVIAFVASFFNGLILTSAGQWCPTSRFTRACLKLATTSRERTSKRFIIGVTQRRRPRNSPEHLIALVRNGGFMMNLAVGSIAEFGQRLWLRPNTR